jgi:ligand-binding sensor domain-containing protein/class 3 adenylate cyclase
MKSILYLFIVVLFLGVLPQNTIAQVNSIKFRNISVKQGLSHKNVICVLQDKEGYIWLGTKNGLNKYDGYQFTTYKQPTDSNLNGLSGNHILSLFEDNEGILWIGTKEGGLNSYNRTTGKFKAYKNQEDNPNSISSNDIYAIAEDDSKNLWIGTFGGGLCLFDRKTETFKTFSKESGLSSNSVFAIVPDGADKDYLWLGTFGGGLVHFNTKTKQSKVFRQEDENGLTSNDIYALYQDAGKNLWIGTYGGGLCYLDYKTKKIRSYVNNPLNKWSISSNLVLSIQSDALGNFWIGTKDGGLNRFIPETGKFYAYKYNVTDLTSISNNDINQVYISPSGMLWAATDGGGVCKFETANTQFNTYVSNSLDGFKASSVTAVTQDEQGNYWVGTFEDGLYQYNVQTEIFTQYKEQFESQDDLFSLGAIDGGLEQKVAITALCNDADRNGLWIGTSENGLYFYDKINNTFKSYKADGIGGLSSNSIESIIIDKKGKLWIGTYDAGLSYFDPENDLFTSYQAGKNGGIAGNAVEVIYEDKNGNIWIGTREGLSVLQAATKKFKNYVNNPKDSSSLPNNYITTIAEDKEGRLWIGTYDGGLCQLDANNDTFKVFTTQTHGLPDNIICGLLLDNHSGNFWISSGKGLAQFNPKTLEVIKYDLDDGLPTVEFVQSAYFKSRKGEILFGGQGCFISFNPKKVKQQTYLPQIHLTGLRKLGKPVLFDLPFNQLTELKLHEVEDQFVTFEFVYLNYDEPERTQYQYKMEPFDKEWRSSGSLRFADYTNLNDGEYILRVRAIDKDGHISKNEATLKVIVLPPWYDTWWAKTLAALIVVGGAFGYYRNRIRSIEAQKKLLEKLVDERTAELAEEKNKSEKLLLNILPEKTAEELKNKGSATPRFYDLATVLFTDFKGFTMISETLAPEELVGELNQCFMLFDEIIEKHNIEKIKTIGDAYMCAAGLPHPNRTNPIDVVLAGLEMQQIMRVMKERYEAMGKQYWSCRLGIHTGPLVAGVIGKKKFAYDVWGDTVNTASRMESSGEVGMVNISGNTYEYVKDYFEFEYRGKVSAKNKGNIDMYFVLRIKPEYAADEQGIQPNELFLQKIEQLKKDEVRENIK